jgi:DNA/RNA endonuclease G (NUC1)
VTWLRYLRFVYRVAGFDQDVDYDRPHLYYDDARLDPNHRITANTFGTLNGVQYHVGHMVPNEVINRQFGRLAQMETFFMSNMSPQRGTLNTGVWLKLENKIRNIEETSGKDHIWAITGPIFNNNPETITRPGSKEVPIPISYYCIIVDPFRYPWDRPSNVDVAYFVIPQDAERNTPLDSFLSDRATVEAATDLDFFPQWPPPVPGVAPAVAPSLGAPETRHRLLRQLY